MSLSTYLGHADKPLDMDVTYVLLNKNISTSSYSQTKTEKNKMLERSSGTDLETTGRAHGPALLWSGGL